jgi:transcriptional regulator with XRE-family HTH domain
MTTAREKHEYVAERRHATLTPAQSLRIARELQGLTQTELARQSGIPQSTISAFESGREDMGLKRIKLLAAALRVHPAVIAFPEWEAEVVDLSDYLRRAAPRPARAAHAVSAKRGARTKAKPAKRRHK